MMESKAVKRSLSLLKNRIGRNQALWDTYKAASNPYEMVYMAPPCVVCSGDDAARKHPISRAFYKLWEIACDDDGLSRVLRDPEPKSFAYVAEAPGSFVEAIVTFRRDLGFRGVDVHRGITLDSDNKRVPHWKLPWVWMRAFNVEISRGADGTGDVTRLENVETFVSECGGDGSCDVVTGDGGFDFSSDFNTQEVQMTKLLASEVLVAMRLLRAGGCAVIKVFDAFDGATVGLLAAFMDSFDRYGIVKPKMSRPGNSERYVVCSGYKPDARAAETRCALERYLSESDAEFPRLTGSAEALDYVVRSNLRHGIVQMASIIETLDLMDRGVEVSCADLSGVWIRTYLTTVTAETEERRPA
jgi:23S rRNA U2552 (ribose-2'-O)-methylase RlmE/FtsJ